MIHVTVPLQVVAVHGIVPKTAPFPHSLMLTSPPASLALAVTAILLPVHAPLAGLVIVTAGGVVSPALTVTLTDAVALCPVPSVTVRLRVWAPLTTPAVFHA